MVTPNTEDVRVGSLSRTERDHIVNDCGRGRTRADNDARDDIRQRRRRRRAGVAQTPDAVIRDNRICT